MPSGINLDPGIALDATPVPITVRSDLGVPVFEFETETDVAMSELYDRTFYGNPRLFRLWEIAGGAHIDAYDGSNDVGNGQAEVENLAAMQKPPTGAGCALPENTGGTHWVLDAAVSWVNRWVEDGVPPPEAPNLQIETGSPGSPPITFAVDANGNALGGVRSPQVDAPVAKLSGIGNSGFGLCSLEGTTTPFNANQLRALYNSHRQFVFRWRLASFFDVIRGYLLPADAINLDRAADASQIGD